MLTTSEINIRDPFVLLEGDTYYMYGTRGATCWGPATGFDVYTSGDLAHWSDGAPCFENDGTFWADRNYWAPEVHRWQGKFYMFASFKSDSRRRGTAILQADSPLGPFVPWSDGPVTPPEWECLDGTFYVDHKGNPWIAYCHEWLQAGDGEIWAARLDHDLKRTVGEPVLMFRASEAAWVREITHSSGRKGYVTDGPFLWRGYSGRLACLWSSFSEGGYTQGMAVSDSGEINSHFSQVKPLFMQNGGHGMLFKTKTGELLLAIHSPNEHMKERPIFLPVTHCELVRTDYLDDDVPD
ncbi:MAG: family 43 glycosylhydrolase [Clostridia bacterium]|nr:family 43 glycosylhydrolase [Clostridia bacterium]